MTSIRPIPLLLNLAMVATAVLAFYTVGPILETKLWPVYSKFKIVDLHETPSGGVEFVIEIRKLRNCTPQGWAWYTGELSNYIQLTVTPSRKDRAPSLPVGRTTSRFTIEGIKASDLPLLYAETFSRCHPFWTTRTDVFP